MRAARRVLLATASTAFAALALGSAAASPPVQSGGCPAAIQTATYTWVQPAFAGGTAPTPPVAGQSAPVWQTPVWIG
ncbi:MAG TPA: hypothetical protein VMH79_15465 [Thermoanaerobaculia bacterium]|nr:hypothetical protein [Thermoanaerobaculia bacterium]